MGKSRFHGRRWLFPFRVSLVAIWLGTVPWAANASMPDAQAAEEAMQVLHDLHEETEQMYREVSNLPYAEREVALNVFVEQQMRSYLDIEHILPQVYGLHWTTIVEKGLQVAAEKAAVALMRNNIRAAFDNYERRSRLRLLRIQTGLHATDQIWISGTVGSPTGTGGRLPFSFIAKVHKKNGQWLGIDLNFLGASLVQFAKSDLQTRIAEHGLETVIRELAAQAVTEPPK